MVRMTCVLGLKAFNSYARFGPNNLQGHATTAICSNHRWAIGPWAARPMAAILVGPHESERSLNPPRNDCGTRRFPGAQMQSLRYCDGARCPCSRVVCEMADNAELSCPAESPARSEPRQTALPLESETHLRGQLQRDVMSNPDSKPNSCPATTAVDPTRFSESPRSVLAGLSVCLGVPLGLEGPHLR